ncbi:hypothetical protein HZA41_00125, partial [Candidatus Peregrinibacteria bacterium]|nr:hypothetical protein [Candidatus Peregrinibacteria bacterium]
MNETTKVFFENDEGREAISYTLHLDYRDFRAKIEGLNEKLVSDLLKRNLKKYKLDPESVNEGNFTEEKKENIKKKFREAVENAKIIIANGMGRLAGESRSPESTEKPTFSPEELKKKGQSIDELYGLAHGGENGEFEERLLVNLGKLSEQEKKGLSEPVIRAKEKEKKRRDLLALYCETDIELDSETDAKKKNNEKIISAGAKLTWIQHEMHTLDYNEQKIWLEEYIEMANHGREDEVLDPKIDNLIKNRVVHLGVASEIFEENPEYAGRFPIVSQRITNGTYRKNQTVSLEDIQQGKTEGIFPEKVNAVEVLTQSPLRSLAGAYLAFAGSMGILLNVLANKGLLKSDLVKFFTNPALLISTGYLTGGLEMVTGEKGIGSGIISDMIGKLRGEGLKDDIANQKV